MASHIERRKFLATLGGTAMAREVRPPVVERRAEEPQPMAADRGDVQGLDHR